MAKEIIEKIVLKVLVDNKTAKVSLERLNKSAERTARKIQDAFKKGRKAADRFDDGIKDVSSSTRKMDKDMDKLGLRIRKRLKEGTKEASVFSKTLKLISAAAILIGLKRLASSGLEVSLQFDAINNSLKATLGSAGAAASELNFLRQVTDELGLNLLTTARSYTKFIAATKGTAIEGEQTREIFLGISEAASALGLSASDAEGALRAIQQIASKGRVSLEELTGQLGERLPGAVELAGKAMGVTRQELFKMIEAGEVMAEELLPKLGKALREQFGDAAKAAAGDSQQARVNRLKNEWEDFLNKVGSSLSTFIPLVTSSVKALNSFADGFGEVITGIDIMINELAGLDEFDKPFSEAEKAQIKLAASARMMARDQKLAAAEARKLIEEVRFFNNLVDKGKFAIELQFIQDELNLTDKGFVKVSGEVTKFLKEGKRIGFIVDDLRKFRESGNTLFAEDDFKDLAKDLETLLGPLDALESKIGKDLNNTFQDLIDKAEEFKQTFSLGKELGLTRKEFEQLASVIDRARKGGFTTDEIKKEIDRLRAEGVLGKGKKEQEFIGSTASTNITAGSAAATEFLRGQQLAVRNADANERTANNMDALLEQFRENGFIIGTL